MPLALHGKGWFIWQVPRCEGGSPAAIAEKAVASGLSHVLIKIAERTHRFGLDRFGRDLVAPVADALRERGLQVWGWHYVYGDRPVDEARVALQRTIELGLHGYVIDAEAEYRHPSKATAARTFAATVRAGLPDHVPVALSSYRYPSLHRQFPWRSFLEHCDLNMPQVYWEKAHNPEQQLIRSVSEFGDADLVGFVRPVVPTGSAYGTGNWRATPEDLQRFLAQARSLDLPAANLYSWDYATSHDNTDLWQAAANFDWPSGTAESPQPDIVARYLEALNAGNLDDLLSLYAPNVGHVTAERTVVGQEPLRAWFHALLEQTLPSAAFTLTDYSALGNSRHFKWTATSPRGLVLDGDDTLGLVDGAIQYHYTYFTVTPAT